MVGQAVGEKDKGGALRSADQPRLTEQIGGYRRCDAKHDGDGYRR
jgi:hypothetical protein